MNINYYKKIKKKYFTQQKKNISLITDVDQSAKQARKVNPKLNCGTNQPNPYFTDKNAKQTKPDRTGPPNPTHTSNIFSFNLISIFCINETILSFFELRLNLLFIGILYVDILTKIYTKYLGQLV